MLTHTLSKKQKQNLVNTGDYNIQNALDRYEDEKAEVYNHFMRMAMDTESLEPFDMDHLFDVQSELFRNFFVWDTSISIFGTRRTGKTTIAKHILVEANERNLIGGCAVITGSKHDKGWHDIIPYNQIYETDQAMSFFNQLKKRQIYLMDLIDRGKKLPKNMPLQFTVILDDFIHDRSLARYSTELIEAFVNFRHYGVVCIVLSQYPTGVGPMIRGNSDFVFLLPQNGLAAKKTLIQDHLEFLPDFRLSMMLLDKATKNHRALVIHKTDSQIEYIDEIQWFRAHDYDGEARKNDEPHCMIQIGQKDWRQKQNADSENLKRKERNELNNMAFTSVSRPIISGEMQRFRDIMWSNIKN